jgi:bifunctional DNA-binding transcriptional regulator/antitoxin component of YhaV-PrlF toxin-antitoxin module
MVKFRIRANKIGQFYLPKELREELGHNLECIGNARAVVLFKSGMSAEDVLHSVRVIMADLEHRVELEKLEGGTKREA